MAPFLTGLSAGLLFTLCGALIAVSCVVGGVFLGLHLAKRKKPKKPPMQPRVDSSVTPTEATAKNQGSTRTPPRVTPFIERAIALHAQAVRHWHRGEHKEADSAMEQAVNLSMGLQNPWLDEELFSEYASLLCGLSQFEKASQMMDFVQDARAFLGNAPKSSYVDPKQRIGDLTWMIRAHTKDLERNQDAFMLHAKSARALDAGNFVLATRYGRLALDSAELTAGLDHWITAAMHNALAQVCIEYAMKQQDHNGLDSAHEHWKQADLIMEEWPDVLPEMVYAIKHNLKLFKGNDEGEEWKNA